MERINNITISTLGGALLSISVNIDPSDLLKTAIYGVIGTTVSYLVSKLLNRLFNRRGRQQTE